MCVCVCEDGTMDCVVNEILLMTYWSFGERERERERERDESKYQIVFPFSAEMGTLSLLLSIASANVRKQCPHFRCRVSVVLARPCPVIILISLNYNVNIMQLSTVALKKTQNVIVL